MPPPHYGEMKESYSSTVTETDDLGGAENATSSSTYVCDRCGFAYPKSELVKTGEWELCERCIDKEHDE